MGSVSSDQEWLDEVSERFDLESYCLSADVSESESCCSSPATTTNTVHRGVASTSSSPFGGAAFSGQIPVMLPPVVGGRHVINPLDMAETPETELDEVELMKERFAKLLLGEDMSGGGKGVCTALAISNAITNLSASMFGQLWKLEPMSPEKKTMWQREMGWLLCVTDNIVELVPSMQEFPGGRRFEVMVPQQRYDLYLNLPALKKLDGMLLSILDGFVNCEFYYVDRGANVSDADENQTFPVSVSSGRPSVRQEEKWWLPFPKVPSNGLSEDTRKRLQQCRECTNQILKAAKAINGNALVEMEIPNAYLESLPKSGKACLGELMYRYITSDQFSPDRLLDYLDLSSEYTTLEIANRIEAAAHIWRQKYLKRHLVCKKNGKSTWGAKVKGFVGEEQRRKLLAKRAEILLHNLRQRFPGLPQTALDVNKIQYNKDVGSAIIESYSRVMESLAFNIMARIDDLLFADDATKQPTKPTSLCSNHGTFRGAIPKQKQILPTTSHYLSGRGASAYTMQPVDGSHDLIRKFNGRTDHSFNKRKDTLDQTLEKLTF